MRRVSYAEGRELERTKVCAVCGGRLNCAWGGQFDRDGYVIRCENLAHEGEVEPKRAPLESQPYYIQNMVKRKEKERIMEEYGEQTAMVVAKYQGVKILKEEQANEIIRSFWPQAPDIEVKKAMLTCLAYGLNPIFGHLYLVAYRVKDKNDNYTGEVTWTQMRGISADRLLASRRGGVTYLDNTPRMMSEEEQILIRGVYEKENWWAICKVADKDGLVAQGLGKWSKSVKVKGAEKGNTQQNMAGIRAERQALDRKFPGEMPGGDVVDGAYMERGEAQLENGEVELLEKGDIPSGLFEDGEGKPKLTMRVSGQVEKAGDKHVATDKAWYEKYEHEVSEGEFTEEQTGTVEGQTEASTTVKSPAKRTKSEAPAAKASKPTVVYRTEEQRAKIMALGGWDEYDFIGVCIARFDPNGNKQFKSDNQITAATADLWIVELEMAAAAKLKEENKANTYEEEDSNSDEERSEAPDVDSTPPAGDGDYLPTEVDGPFIPKAGVIYQSKKNTDIPKATLIKKEKGENDAG